MEKIVVKEKPENISWDEIHDLLWTAHAKNREAGMYMKAPAMSSEEMKAHVGENGKCFVAMDGEKLVGTCSFKIVCKNKWYAKGCKVAYCMLEGVLPEYQGRGVYSQLITFREEHIRQCHADLMEMNTAEHNLPVQKALLRKGWTYVDFIAYKTTHYSVVMVKWLNDCPFSKWKCWWMFTSNKWKEKIKYKPGRVKRFKK
ncbi:MAG: GNAT family N-acetyltransferase [Prevotella sp.]|nr:GNAT family N-acetyltransferase [Prevotella sp.]